MAKKRADPIAVVEAAYDLSVNEPEWLTGLARTATHLVPNTPHGLIAYQVVLGDRVRIEHIVGCERSAAGITAMRAMQARLSRTHAGPSLWHQRILARLSQRVVRAWCEQSAERLTFSEHDVTGPQWLWTLGVPQLHDVFLMRCAPLTGRRISVLAAGLRERRVLTAKQRALYLMLAAHIKAGFRLRRRLTGWQDCLQPLDQDGAILDGSSLQLLHAEGEARTADSRQALRDMALRIDRARSEQHGRDEQAVEVWQGLLDGRWSLIEQFDSDGRRFIVAHRNTENMRDPRGLTQMEAMVAGLAAQGHANKVIAYHLGIAESTVSTHLHRALSKLQLGSRAELMRALGSSPVDDGSSASAGEYK